MLDDAIFIAIELRHENLERYAHKLYTEAGFCCLYSARRWRITSQGRRGQKREGYRDEWLIPGYLAIAHDGQHEFWQRVAAVTYPKALTPIMLQPVRIAGCDTIPVRDVADLMDRCGDHVMTGVVPYLKSEDRVRILADPFAGFSGTIGSVDGDIADVFVKMFGRETKTRIAIDKLEKVAAA